VRSEGAAGPRLPLAEISAALLPPNRGPAGGAVMSQSKGAIPTPHAVATPHQVVSPAQGSTGREAPAGLMPELGAAGAHSALQGRRGPQESTRVSVTGRRVIPQADPRHSPRAPISVRGLPPASRQPPARRSMDPSPGRVPYCGPVTDIVRSHMSERAEVCRQGTELSPAARPPAFHAIRCNTWLTAHSPVRQAPPNKGPCPGGHRRRLCGGVG